MPEQSDNQKGMIARFMALPTDSVPKTVFVAVVLCLVASMVVSAAAVSLRPTQQANAVKDKQVNILQVAGRYEPGMAYGDHVDNAIMGRFGPKPMRTDVSFTIFLSDPGEYEGGELVIDSDISPTAFKLPPGHAVIYPTHYLHRVNPVTRGVRQVVVGWVQSLIREPERRQVLLDLQQAMGQLQSTLPGGPNHPAFVRLHKIYINLQRMWSEV